MTTLEDRFGDQWEDFDGKSQGQDEEQRKKDSWKLYTPSAADIKPVPISWLWRNWIATGKLTILAGAAGTGKTTLSLGLAATVTNGRDWPDGQPSKGAKNVLVWSAEDDDDDTIVPRLMAAGADLTRVRVIKDRYNELGERVPFNLATDIDLLDQRLEELKEVALVIIEPLVLAVSKDMNKANDVRAALQPLVEVSRKHRCAVLGITHFSKGTGGGNPAERVLGSQAFGAVARTVLVAAKDQESGRCVLARAKSNISADTGGCIYEILECDLGDGIVTTKADWKGTVEGTAREILSDVEETESETKRTERDDACDFLRIALRDGPVPVKQLRADAEGWGVAWATVRRAQKIVGASAVKQGGGFGSDQKAQWVWLIKAPSDDVVSTEGAHPVTEGAHPNTEGAHTQESEHLPQKVSTFREDVSTFREGGSDVISLKMAEKGPVKPDLYVIPDDEDLLEVDEGAL